MLTVGIDIGTSYSSIALLDSDGKAQPVKVANGACIFGDSYSMPSAVYVDEGGNIMIGQLAVSSKLKNPSNFKDEFKRDLGQQVPYHLGSLQLMPEDLYKEIFVYFKKCAEEAAGEKISKAYISYPANFGRKKRELIELAAKKASFLDIEMIDEPTAAAYCYCEKGKVKDGEKLLVYDLGGGTFDVALIEYTSTGFKPVTQALGIDKCGGIDIDRLIFEDICSNIPEEAFEMLKSNELALKRFNAQIMELSVKIKHQLSSTDSFKDMIPIGVFEYVEYELTKEKLNKIISFLIEETLLQIKNIVKNAELTMDNINTYLLVGGTSRIPYIRERVEQLTGKPAYKDIDAELAICMGAALLKKSKGDLVNVHEIRNERKKQLETLNKRIANLKLIIRSMIKDRMIYIHDNIDEWINSINVKSDLQVFKLKETVEAVVNEIVEKLSKKINSEQEKWYNKTLRPFILGEVRDIEAEITLKDYKIKQIIKENSMKIDNLNKSIALSINKLTRDALVNIIISPYILLGLFGGMPFGLNSKIVMFITIKSHLKKSIKENLTKEMNNMVDMSVKSINDAIDEAFESMKDVLKKDIVNV